MVKVFKANKRFAVERIWDPKTETFQVRLTQAGRYFWMTEAEAQSLRDSLTRTLREIRVNRKSL